MTMAEIGAKSGLPQVNIDKNAGVFDLGRSSIAIAKEAGVALGFGTDLLGEAQPWQNREFAIRAELEPAVVPASRLFDAYSGAPLDDPRTRLILDDARALLQQPDIDGALVGGASLTATSFLAIVDAATQR